jgi:hypothetical protein
MERTETPENSFVLVVGLSMAGDSFDLGSSLTLRRTAKPMTVFDLAAAGAAGFREWAMMEPFARQVVTEIQSPTAAVSKPGYDALNKCWLVSALLALRGFPRHICPAVSAYSWNLVAGHQEATAPRVPRTSSHGRIRARRLLVATRTAPISWWTTRLPLPRPSPASED